MNVHTLRWTSISIGIVYLVIFAGAIVRMTGSGMGCPDWPKCFGYLIPPTDRSELNWIAHHDYKEGNVIIVEESLAVAATDFTSSERFNPDYWNPYTKHDYSEFNALHTWVEFINRLLGALAGIAVFVLFIISLSHLKKNSKITALSFLVFLAMGFQAWLGKTVVDSNLLPHKISLHMFMALVIIALLLWVRALAKPFGMPNYPSKSIQHLLYLAFGFTLIQFILGVQVRQFVDLQIDKWGYTQAQLWLSNPEWSFYIHRSLSIVVIIVNMILFLKVRSEKLHSTYINWILVCIIGEIVLGILMYYIDFPFGTQSLHLLLATIIFGLQWYWILRIKINYYGISI